MPSFRMSPVPDMRKIVTIILLLISLQAVAQDELVSEEAPKFTFKGYLKNMSSFNWYDSLFFENLLMII